MVNEFHVRSVKIPGTSFYLIASASRPFCICMAGRPGFNSPGRPPEPTAQDHQTRREGEAGSRHLGGSRADSLEGSSGDSAGFIFLSPKLCRSSYFSGLMIPRFLALLALLSTTAADRTQAGTNANRLTYLDENDPFFVGLKFPKLTAPQWVGEPGVEA